MQTPSGARPCIGSFEGCSPESLGRLLEGQWQHWLQRNDRRSRARDRFRKQNPAYEPPEPCRGCKRSFSMRLLSRSRAKSLQLPIWQPSCISQRGFVGPSRQHRDAHVTFAQLNPAIGQAHNHRIASTKTKSACIDSVREENRRTLLGSKYEGHVDVRRTARRWKLPIPYARLDAAC